MTLLVGSVLQGCLKLALTPLLIAAVGNNVCVCVAPCNGSKRSSFPEHHSACTRTEANRPEVAKSTYSKASNTQASLARSNSAGWVRCTRIVHCTTSGNTTHNENSLFVYSRRSGALSCRTAAISAVGLARADSSIVASTTLIVVIKCRVARRSAGVLV